MASTQTCPRESTSTRDGVENGEQITIARAGRPVARLVAVEHPAPRTLGFAPGRLDDAFFEPLPQHELDSWQNPQ